jgi:hypothetical protein
MKRVLVITVLALLLMSTVGVGVVAAKQDENPRPAGKSSVYFYDVAASDTHGKGKLVIDVDKHTFLFNGQGFTPSLQIALRARAAGSTDYVMFAWGKTTPSGNLHLAGTWKADATPAEVVADYPEIAAFDLYNLGWFVAQLACYYSTDGGVTWKESSHVTGITNGEGGFAELDDLGVPDGALVKMHAVVVGGKDRTGSELYWYGHYRGYDTGYYAEYHIYGTTGNPELLFAGLNRW